MVLLSILSGIILVFFALTLDECFDVPNIESIPITCFCRFIGIVSTTATRTQKDKKQKQCVSCNIHPGH